MWAIMEGGAGLRLPSLDMMLMTVSCTAQNTPTGQRGILNTTPKPKPSTLPSLICVKMWVTFSSEDPRMSRILLPSKLPQKPCKN